MLDCMNSERFYPIGTPGTPWNDANRLEWFQGRSIARSYDSEVLSTLRALDAQCNVFTYGALPINPTRYPLMAVQIDAKSADAPWALITGGVHGYETSGVQGALTFLAHHGNAYRDRANLLVAPCVSPWGYEVINR